MVIFFFFLGFCPKTLCVFDGLTVEQNLKFMSKIYNSKADINYLLKETYLTEYKKTSVSRLTKGQKRLLSLAMVFMGNFKYMFIEEPVRGYDKVTKRKIWKFISRNSKGRTIIFFSSDVDEIEVLAERKLILFRGQTLCLGTNEFIKTRLIDHYYINVKTSSIEAVNEVIKSVIPTASLLKYNNKKKIIDLNNGHIWRLPVSAASNFSMLCKIINKRIKTDGIIKEYSIYMPTLLEYYDRLDDEFETELLEFDGRDVKNEKAIAKTIPHPQQFSLPYELHSIKILTKNRILNTIKNHKYCFWSILIPISLAVYAFDTYEVNRGNTLIKPESINIGSEYLYNDNKFIWNYDPYSNVTSSSYKILKYVKDKSNRDVLVYDKSIGHMTLNAINELSVTNQLNNTFYVSSVIGYRINRYHYRYDLIYNATLVHSLPTTINAISNSLLYSKGIKQRIYTTCKPFEYNSVDVIRKNSFKISRMFGFIMMFASYYFLYYANKEEEKGIYTIFRSFGVNKKIFFITALAGDFVLSTLLNLIILIMGIRFKNPLFKDRTALSMFFNIMTLG